jgi:hypothetical protein
MPWQDNNESAIDSTNEHPGDHARSPPYRKGVLQTLQSTAKHE